MDDLLSNDILVNSSDAMVGHELDEDDSWVLVQKQKITILVPPPSPLHNQITRNRRKQSKSKNMVRKEMHTRKKKLVKHTRPGKKRLVQNRPEHETHMEEDTRMTSIADISPLHADTSHHISFDSTHKDGECMVSNEKHILENYGSSKIVSFSHWPTAGAIEVVNLRLRAANLEKQLVRLGGLKKWLMSLGLVQFAKMFEKEKMGKFHLASLTMGKLKEMGAEAVGPRRKLLHAIDRISQPYFSKT